MSVFSGTASSTLRALAAAIRSGQLVAPLTDFGIQRAAPSTDNATGVLLKLSNEGMSPQHLALLLDEAAEVAEAKLDGHALSELVWTGPEGTTSHSRDTAVVVQELFSNARNHVLVSSYAVYRGATVFLPLAARMQEIPTLRVQLFLHIGRERHDTREESELLREFATGFATEWPWSQRPEIYYDPRTVATDPAERAAWHAKCVLVDDELALVTSANLTDWAQQRNIEAGVLVRGRHLAAQLRGQFNGLVETRQVRRLPGFD